MNEAPSDVQYQWTTLEGQRSRGRGKPRPKHPYAEFALDNQACDLLNPTPVLPQLQALPAAQLPPAGTPPWEVEGVLDPIDLFGNQRTFNFCQLMVQARLSQPHMDAFIMDQHANTAGTDQPLLVHNSAEVLLKYNQVAEEFGLQFKEVTFHLEALGTSVVLHHRPPEKLARWLYLRPSTLGKMAFQPNPRVSTRPDGSTMRIYESFASGKWMEQAATKIPPGSELMPIMKAYDKTHLDLQGTQKAFGHYWVPNGLHLEDKQKISNWWVYALRPIIMTNRKSRQEQKALLTAANMQLRKAVNEKLVELQSPLVTEGIDVASWDGSTVTKVHPVVSNSTVDREEAYGIAAIKPGHGDVPYRNCTDCYTPTG